MAETIEIRMPSGRSFRAYAAGPAAGPGVVLVHEWWGLDDVTRNTAERIGELGLRALAVDLYDGALATDRKAAAALMGSLDKKVALEKVDAGVRHLAASGAKVGTIGWCMGGGLALRAALSQPDEVAATAIFYGEIVDDPAVLATLGGPVLGVFAEKDGWITKEMAQRFDAALTKVKVPHVVRVFPADHAFFNPTSPNHDAACAADAWALVADHFRKNLA